MSSAGRAEDVRGAGAVGLVQGGLCEGVGSWPKCSGAVRLVAWAGQQQ